MTSHQQFAWICIGATSLCPACNSGSSIAGVPDQMSEDASTNDTGPVHPGCPSTLPGPPMTEVSTSDGAAYCIDSREVSQGDYFVFLSAFLRDPTGNYNDKIADAGPWPSGPGCEGNLSLTPAWGIDESPCGVVFTAFSRYNTYPELPIACVDWCDAYAYCAWAGKRLCGRVGGGSLAALERNDPSHSEWFNVCSQQGKTAYSYGDTYEAGFPSWATANATNPDGGTWKPGEANADTGCKGTGVPFSQVINMSCNVAEWEDSCTTVEGGAQLCILHSIAAGDMPLETSTRCDATVETDRGMALNIGFRCCHD